MKRIKRLARRFWLPLTLLVVVAAILLLLVRLALWGYHVGWTGFAPSPNFPKARPITIAQPPKQLWDWLQLISALLVPIVVAGVGLWFTHRLRQTETEIAKDRQQEDDLLAYVDRMSELLIEKQLATHESPREARLVARVLTTTALRQLLDKRRRNAVLRFLTAADLINTAESQDRANSQDGPVESFLRGANLRWIDWSKAPLAGVDLHGVDLTGVDLTGADLTEADLTGADLTEADLTEANLRGAILRGAILIKSTLGKADLRGANLRGANLTGANLAGADLSGADLRDAVLTGANLSDANLSDANLRKIQLGEAKLRGAKLRGADLTGARLRGAKVTNEQLNAARSLAGVILPKGRKLPDDFKGRLPYDKPPTPSGTPPTPPPPAPSSPSTPPDASQVPTAASKTAAVERAPWQASPRQLAQMRSVLLAYAPSSLSVGETAREAFAGDEEKARALLDALVGQGVLRAPSAEEPGVYWIAGWTGKAPPPTPNEDDDAVSDTVDDATDETATPRAPAVR